MLFGGQLANGKIKHFNYLIYIHKRVRPLTRSLTQYCPRDSMEDWVTNFGVQVGFECLTQTNVGFCEIARNCPEGGRHQKNVFEHNVTPNYLTMTKLFMG